MIIYYLLPNKKRERASERVLIESKIQLLCAAPISALIHSCWRNGAHCIRVHNSTHQSVLITIDK